MVLKAHTSLGRSSFQIAAASDWNELQQHSIWTVLSQSLHSKIQRFNQAVLAASPDLLLSLPSCPLFCCLCPIMFVPNVVLLPCCVATMLLSCCVATMLCCNVLLPCSVLVLCTSLCSGVSLVVMCVLSYIFYFTYIFFIPAPGPIIFHLYCRFCPSVFPVYCIYM